MYTINDFEAMRKVYYVNTRVPDPGFPQPPLASSCNEQDRIDAADVPGRLRNIR